MAIQTKTALVSSRLQVSTCRAGWAAHAGVEDSRGWCSGGGGAAMKKTHRVCARVVACCSTSAGTLSCPTPQPPPNGRQLRAAANTSTNRHSAPSHLGAELGSHLHSQHHRHLAHGAALLLGCSSGRRFGAPWLTAMPAAAAFVRVWGRRCACCPVAMPIAAAIGRLQGRVASARRLAATPAAAAVGRLLPVLLALLCAVCCRGMPVAPNRRQRRVEPQLVDCRGAAAQGEGREGQRHRAPPPPPAAAPLVPRPHPSAFAVSSAASLTFTEQERSGSGRGECGRRAAGFGARRRLLARPHTCCDRRLVRSWCGTQLLAADASTATRVCGGVLVGQRSSSGSDSHDVKPACCTDAWQGARSPCSGGGRAVPGWLPPQPLPGRERVLCIPVL